MCGNIVVSTASSLVSYIFHNIPFASMRVYRGKRVDPCGRGGLLYGMQSSSTLAHSDIPCLKTTGQCEHGTQIERAVYYYLKSKAIVNLSVEWSTLIPVLEAYAKQRFHLD
ncbi:hypothetical protein RRG08_005737 [Elysia crispata]|uniref:Uncharacterized protein n=1 Tax=Elysia crispata TaxID=231223 RepID=A0AAE1CWK9_9GAST|nr:hypothetical protein RRG08_005737 [Elysia crispata]